MCRFVGTGTAQHIRIAKLLVLSNIFKKYMVTNGLVLIFSHKIKQVSTSKLSLSRKYLVFLMTLKSKFYFYVVSSRSFSRQYFNVTINSLEISKVAINSQFFLITKSSNQGLEVFFQIIFLIKYLRRSLSLAESSRRTAAFTKTKLFHRDLQNIYFDIKEYLFCRTSKQAIWCLLLRQVESYLSDT